MRTHRTQYTIFGITLLIAMLIRGLVIVDQIENFNDDPDAYRIIAVTLAETGTFGLPAGDSARPTAFRPPLYPWILSWCVDDSGRLSNSSVGVLHWILGSLTIAMTLDLCRRLGWAWPAVVAAMLTAIDPILIWQSTLVMTETLATSLTMAAWWWWVLRLTVGADESDDRSRQSSVNQRFRPLITGLGVGVLMGLAFLCRPTFLVWAIAVIPALAWSGVGASVGARVGPINWKRGGTTVLIAMAILIGVVAMWTVRNRNALGHPIWATSHGGYTLLLANNDSFYDYLETRDRAWPWAMPAWDPQPFFDQYAACESVSIEVADNEVADHEISQDAVAYEMAKSTIRARPSMFAWSCWVRLVRLWQPFPHATPSRSTAAILAVGGFYVLIDAMIVVALFRHRRWLWWCLKSTGGIFRSELALPRNARQQMIVVWPAIAMILTLSAVHTFYWSNPRMRAPANPILAVAAAAALCSSRSFHESSDPIADRPE